MEIDEKTIKLIPAQESDRKRIYNWLCKSDLTSSVLGLPTYPDHPIPTWQEFCATYPLSFFNASGDGRSRVFIIVADGVDVGTLGYDLLDKKKNSVVLDIWMKAEQYCGQGYGRVALNALCAHVYENYGITTFAISPSRRNKRAIAAYEKAGFKYIKTMDRQAQENEFGISEYDDNILMLKRFAKTQSI